MSDIQAIPSEPKKEKPSARITMHEDHVKNMKVGMPHSMKMSGKIKGISKSYSHDNHYDVEMEDPQIESEDTATEDNNAATMPKEKLKEKISKNEY